MRTQDDQDRLAFLAEMLRRELNESLEQASESARHVALAGSSEAQLDLGWWMRLWLETQLIPSALAIAVGVCELESGNREDSSHSEPFVGRMRALITRIQTQPLLDMDSEFERYIAERHKTLFPGRSELLAGDWSREDLANKTFEARVAELVRTHN